VLSAHKTHKPHCNTLPYQIVPQSRGWLYQQLSFIQLIRHIIVLWKPGVFLERNPSRVYTPNDNLLEPRSYFRVRVESRHL
jgi:hypothetical protein